MIHRRSVPLAALALTTLAVTGCSASPAETVEPRILTIAELLGQDTEWDDDAYQEREAQVQDLIAVCMAEKGWEYIPVDYPDDFYEYSDEDERTRREREGYGIAYWTLNRGEDAGVIDPPNTWVDPNQAYIESLTESELVAYTEDLYGDAILYTDAKPMIDPGTDVLPSPGTTFNIGCMGEASNEVYGETPEHSEEYWNAMNRFYEELYERVSADPRIKALDGEWVACMRAAGFEYDGPNAVWETAYTDFQSRHDEIVGPDFYADPFEDWTQQQIDDFWATATQEQIDDLFNAPIELTDAQRTALEALLGDEVELALADFDCTKPYNEDYQGLAALIEEEYALEHQAEIEALLASEPE